MPNKQYKLHLPYYKQGDDLQAAIKATNSDEEALLAHAETLRAAAEYLTTLSQAKGLKIEIAETHLITVSMPEEVAARLLDALLPLDLMDDEEVTE